MVPSIIRAFMWRLENQIDGISIPWTSVSLHAITSEPARSIYMQLDFRLKWPGNKENPPPNGNGNGHNHMAEENEEDEDVDEGNVSGWYLSLILNCIPETFSN